MTPGQFNDLLKMVTPIIQQSDTIMREALPAKVKLEITLAFLASGTNFRMLCWADSWLKGTDEFECDGWDRDTGEFAGDSWAKDKCYEECE
ncbi:hypothetical protein PR048_011579 [Dryococelus australis]|uniref:Uncharacterized protein n=1 Tax=Dryococelus australis TaxID=614101 RepID=A0ABQ9HMB0_9NEOP|nr:hypothetical protein PR048_011579 [Dryococelus australis]